eukprot:5589649-Prymnesium_polylepis.2
MVLALGRDVRHTRQQPATGVRHPTHRRRPRGTIHFYRKLDTQRSSQASEAVVSRQRREPSTATRQGSLCLGTHGPLALLLLWLIAEQTGVYRAAVQCR